MRYRIKLVFTLILGIILYYVFSFVSFYVRSSEAYILSDSIKEGQTISDENLKKIRVNFLDKENIENFPVGKIATKDFEAGKILFKSDLASEYEEYDNTKEEIAVSIENADVYLIDDIINRGYVNLYYISDVEAKEAYDLSYVKVVNIYDENGNVVENMSSSPKSNIVIIVKVEKEKVKDIKKMQRKGTFEISV